MPIEDDPTEWHVETELRGTAEEAFFSSVAPEAALPADMEAQTGQGEEQEQGSAGAKTNKPAPRFPPPRSVGPAVDRNTFNEDWDAKHRAAAAENQAAKIEHNQDRSTGEHFAGAAQEEAMVQPGGAIRDDFNMKADELGTAQHDVDVAQARVDTLSSYAEPVNPGTGAVDIVHARGKQQNQKDSKEIEDEKEQDEGMSF